MNINLEMLGFGCMRLPVTDKKNATSFDYPKIERLFDMFLENGFTYFDTAYTYHGYQGEKAVRKTLTERYPRESFQLASKLPLRDFKDRDDMECIFKEQLINCGVDYFDFYLLHNMGHNVYQKCVNNNAFEFVQRKKAEGKIKKVGMSFHDIPELLEEILSKFGDYLDFLQLQINYIDWEQPNVQSRRCLEIANKYEKPVTVMEPCKGGSLVNVSKDAEQLMKSYAKERSIASWALRFAASQPGVVRVLSGMNELAQVLDNCSTFQNFEPLTEDEYEILEQVKQIILKNTAIQCTSCEYCVHNCPRKIAIPKYFSLYNSIMQTTGSFSSQAVYYNNLVLSGYSKASECIRCGLCEKVCPQQLPIRENLKKIANKFEK